MRKLQPIQWTIEERETVITKQEIGPLVLNAWNGHYKRNSFETRAAVIAHIMGMDGIDWDAFKENGASYRDYWDRHGWQFNSETLLGWVRNGYSPAPPEKQADPRFVPAWMREE